VHVSSESYMFVVVCDTGADARTDVST